MQILSPAKINLFLQVVGKRSDGYHELRMLMCRVGLFDIVTLKVGAPGITVTCSDPSLPQDESNLAGRAAHRFYAELAHTPNRPAEGVAIAIAKNIPVGAGLGGGSSNAAAVLMGLNRYYHHPFSDAELAAMGLGVGADVPFFLFKRPAVATGIGEKLEPYEKLTPMTVLLVFPGFSVSTAEVYKNLNLRLTKCEKIFTNPLFKIKEFDVINHLCNDLETVTAIKFPEIITIKKRLLAQGAVSALMSGSGPTVFGLFKDVQTALQARHTMARSRRWQVFSANMLVE